MSPATPTRSRATRDLHPGAARTSCEDLVDALTCPVSGKLFVDPVTVSSADTPSPTMPSATARRLRTELSHVPRAATTRTLSMAVNTTLVDLVERFFGDEPSTARSSPRRPDVRDVVDRLDLEASFAFVLGHHPRGDHAERVRRAIQPMVRRCPQGSRRLGWWV